MHFFWEYSDVVAELYCRGCDVCNKFDLTFRTLQYGVIHPLSRLMEVQRVSTVFRGVHSMKGRLLELHDITLCLANRAVFGVRCNWSLGANLECHRENIGIRNSVIEGTKMFEGWRLEICKLILNLIKFANPSSFRYLRQ